MPEDLTVFSQSCDIARVSNGGETRTVLDGVFTDIDAYIRLQSREKLPAHNTIDDAVNLIRSSRRIIVLTGAGISTSSSRSRVPC